MPSLGPTELIIILVIVLAVFGAGRLATLGGALGKGVHDFRKSIQEGDDQKQATVSKAEAQAESKNLNDSGSAA